ncbi:MULTISPECIES: PKD domain-containing protein [Flavobacterium]|uniref:PKD domain-containing protein n=1 Tax=Flavobacterium jumunjinense TaxID=998845 RepID=A0ABV5GLR2_9FLAO|nr:MULTISPECIES: PKD domain-containing protein [Flavobacterium]
MFQKSVTLLFLVFYCVLFSQTHLDNKDTLSRKAIILPKQDKNTFIFNSETPLLNQIAGAPKAYYTYFWELGDGNYSTKKDPKHTYKKPGEYEVKLWVTNNYDTGKTPTTRPTKVKTNETADISENEIQIIKNDIDLKRNREPLPDEDFIIVLTYKNEKDYVTNGTVYFYYNEKEFKNDNFELLEISNYHNETINDLGNDLVFNHDHDDNFSTYASTNNTFTTTYKYQDTTERKNLPLSIEEAKQTFKKGKKITFKNLSPNEQRNIFFNLKTTPEMIKDTSAILRVRSIYVPDENYENHKIKDMEMEIVTSHDPNKMSTSGLFINYRLVRFKRIKFKTRFQNDGEGPARTIRLETDVPDMFDKSTLQIESMYPECPICPKNKEVRYSCLDTIVMQKQIIFTFKNIYLPGTQQKNVMEKDSTKGFVKYSLKFGEDFHKKTTKSRTVIIFDKNEPIITNYSRTRFNPGISIGAKAGYNYFPKLNNSRSYFTGFTISPFKAYRFYWQSELYANKHDFESENTNVISDAPENVGPFDLNSGLVIDNAFVRRENLVEKSRTIIETVPISLRYNINNYIGIGFGPQITTIISSKKTSKKTTRYYEPTQSPTNPNFVPGEEYVELTQRETLTNNEKTQIQTQLFLDTTFGFARIGPSVGIRYYKNFKTDFDSWQFYAIWKF